MHDTEEVSGSSVDRRVAGRLASLRAEKGWSLDNLAERTGISRATLSRIERCELSPTAAMLGRICSVYGWTLSRLIADAETSSATVIRASDQTTWRDPETKYVRRIISPPGPGLRGELVEIHLPPAASVFYDASPAAGLEHHLWMLEGTLKLTIHNDTFRLTAGDCVRYVLTGPSRFECTRKKAARYVLAIVRP